MNTSIRFADDAMMAYDAARRVFAPGEQLVFDEAYRLAHLPLVSPAHPDIIRSVPDRDYRDGRYALPRHSLVLPLSFAALARSPGFQALERDMRASSFAAKINWDLCTARAETLHATVIGGLAEPDCRRCIAGALHVAKRYSAVSVRLGGLFLGTKNTGRIYLPVYPERIGDSDVLSLVQDACGAPRTRFFVAGYYHFTDSLTADETADLAAIDMAWRGRSIADLVITSLAIQATNHDLALSARTIDHIEFDGTAGSTA